MRQVCWLGVLILIVGCAAQPQPSSTPVVRPASVDSRAHQCLALAMYWEARGEGRLGMQAVGSVVLNRVAHPQFPDSVCGVIYEGGERPPCQFSWWCDGKSDRPTQMDEWRHARHVAERLLQGGSDDPTHGALFFHSTAVNGAWHKTRYRTARIGQHIFYR